MGRAALAPAARRATSAALGVLAALACFALVPSAAADEEPPCNAWDVEYLLNANVKITDTTMGAGNGVFAIGPGRAVVRFDDRGGAPGGDAKLLEYRMKDHFTVTASILLASASVTADTVTQTTPNACGVAAEGALAGRSLRWRTPWSGMRSDGTVTCDGALCGKFGGPPSGQSPIHVPPHPVTFKPFEYSEDRKTFTMDYSIVSKQDSPSQTSLVALAGREVKRTCVLARPCTR